MADALRKALTGLRALASDHRSGAAEIADRAAALLAEYCRQERPDDPRLPYGLAELAETTLTVQPSLAPLLNLANLVQRAAERDKNPLRRLAAELEKRRGQREQAKARIAREFARRARRYRRVLTYSSSSTVLAALLAAHRANPLEEVVVSEGRPLNEGRLLAERLGAAGIPVTLTVDAALPARVETCDAVVVGTDAVFGDAYVNKVGTRILQEASRRAAKAFFVLADTGKLLPPALAAFHRIEEKPAHEVWRETPAGVSVYNRYFERVPLEAHVTLLSERGPLTPARMRGWLKREPVAQRWREAAAEKKA
jgi:translation initiation factor 2B subunit (eIF-2B alpha/beta/delta family)